MRGWIVLALLLILSIGVSAVNCTDTDGGGAKSGDDAALRAKGDVKYGITTMSDTCITAEEEGVSTNSSKYLKEYYCTGNQRMSEIYDCVKLGYVSCQNGACVASGNGSAPVQRVVPACGNKIIEKDKGEQCDPPNSICFGKTSAEYGTCQADCKCKIAASALQNIQSQPAVCGDGYKHPDEACEEDADCQTSYVCSSCKCVKQLTPEEIEAMKKSAVKEVEKEEVKEEAVEDVSEVDVTAKNFSEEPGIKAASGFANFFKKIFGWIAALFS